MTVDPAAVLLDTGVLVAVLDHADPLHQSAIDWISASRRNLHTVESVLAEAAHFVPAHHRAAVADFVLATKAAIHHPDPGAYRRVAGILGKYADLRPDWADAMLVWVAEQTGIHRIATLDVRDFSAYRIHGRSKFQIEPIR